MKQARAKSVSLTKVSKAVKLPSHPLKPRLERVLEAVDKTHAPKNLKTMPVLLDRRVPGGLFYVHSDTGPYNIYLNPSGTHPELSLLHEVGHYLEWQCIPKQRHGPRDFTSDLRFTAWLQSVYETQTVQQLLALLEDQEEGTQAFNDLAYLLLPNEMWTRAYSQYIARKASFNVVSQQIAAENKVVTGIIKYQPYWSKEEFTFVQEVMDMMFTQEGWAK